MGEVSELWEIISNAINEVNNSASKVNRAFQFFHGIKDEIYTLEEELQEFNREMNKLEDLMK